MASKCSTTEEHTVGEAACILRSDILEICKSAPHLPTALSLEDFKKGQAEIPDLLRSFFTTLLTGHLPLDNQFLEDGGCSTAMPCQLAKSNLEQTKIIIRFVYTRLIHRSLHSQSFKFKMK